MKRVALFILFFNIVPVIAQENISNSLARVFVMEKTGFAKKYAYQKKSLASDNFRVHYYKCKWNIDPAIRYISGSVTAYYTITQSTDTITFDLTRVLKVDSVRLQNRLIFFRQNINETLTLQLPHNYIQGEQDSVSIFYKGVPPVNADAAFVQSQHDSVPIIWTLSEPYGAKDWWPCRNDLNDKADSIDIYITYPSLYKASSNGLLQNETTTGNVTTSYYKHRYPVASYLVGIAVTNYDVFTKQVQLGNTLLPVISYVYPKNLNYFEGRTKFVLQALQLYHTMFGEYPFIKEKYGQTQFGFRGGIEHQTDSFKWVDLLLALIK